MRADNVGFFWDDTPAVKVAKEVVKRTPPERTWELPDYLPHLAEAKAFNVNLFKEGELYAAQVNQERLVFDVECYPNYFLVSFVSIATGKVATFEAIGEDYGLSDESIATLRYIFANFCVIGFNSAAYDLPMCALAMDGHPCINLQEFTKRIILDNERSSDVLASVKLQPLEVNHIDLIEVAPLRANLKIYGGRLHAPRMQDLPFVPGTKLSPDQIAIVRWYNVGADLVSTAFMYVELEEQIKLRERMSGEYGVDLRSKSDAQIAEAIISSQVNRLNGFRAKRPQIETGTMYRYQPPPFLRFQTPLLQQALATVSLAPFVVNEKGVIVTPEAIKNLRLDINRSSYQMGIGGLHSNEQSVYYLSDATHTIYDRDVTSYYPCLILNSGMYPPHLGTNFLTIYNSIVVRRVDAKASGDKVTADSLKITANGTFGKLGSPYSILYAPNLLIQVTLTGQLSLLMLIERMELAGIPVVSANTDGVVMHCPNHLKATYEAIVAQWERDTNLPTEETVYTSLYSRDVNNYIAVKADGKTKAKGAYLNPWNDPKLAVFKFHKNPTNFICSDAVEAYVSKGIPVEHTIEQCRDVRRFVTVRSVRGGAVKDGEYLGKSVRWYYAKDCPGEMVYASTGNKVPRSDGARPLMTLPNTMPADLDFDWYFQEACGMLAALGLPGFKRRDEIEEGEQ